MNVPLIEQILGVQNMSVTQIADALLDLKDEGMLQNELSGKFELVESEVSSLLTLARGHEKIKEAVDKNEISISAVEPLLRKSLEVQEELFDEALKQHTVRKVRALVRSYEMNGSTEPIAIIDYLVVKKLGDILRDMRSLQKQAMTISGAEQLLEPLEDLKQETSKMLTRVVDIVTDTIDEPQEGLKF